MSDVHDKCDVRLVIQQRTANIHTAMTNNLSRVLPNLYIICIMMCRVSRTWRDSSTVGTLWEQSPEKSERRDRLKEASQLTSLCRQRQVDIVH